MFACIIWCLRFIRCIKIVSGILYLVLFYTKTYHGFCILILWHLWSILRLNTPTRRYNKDLLHISKTCNYLLTYLCINACSFLRSRSRNFEHIILYILGCKKQNSGKKIQLMVCCDIIRFYDYLLLKFYQQHECVICVTYYKNMNTM